MPPGARLQVRPSKGISGVIVADVRQVRSDATWVPRIMVAHPFIDFALLETWLLEARGSSGYQPGRR
jgi:hypothetical protein